MIPVIFKVSGQETLDVVTLPYGAPVSLDAISTHILKIPNDGRQLNKNHQHHD
ncbi:MAG TPA: hypothetical protein VEL11_19295 [Candidatus Bathyarchaeia archaeon]|nr:hypothetical protein [Candidatus Bathyarchaeia archaeon]